MLQQPVHTSMLSWISFDQYSAQYSFKATGCFPTYPLSKQRTEVRENEPSHDGYHQSSEKILVETAHQTRKPPVLKPCTLPTELSFVSIKYPRPPYRTPL